MVPSKFFGALAAGRPVLFVGSARSSVAQWIVKHRVGWVLDRDNQPEIVTQLSLLAEDPEQLRELFRHCHSIYKQFFSRSQLIDELDDELRTLVAEATPAFSPARMSS